MADGYVIPAAKPDRSVNRDCDFTPLRAYRVKFQWIFAGRHTRFTSAAIASIFACDQPRGTSTRAAM